MRLVPRTLGMQLVAVTSAAVLLSNLAVAGWFELTTERQSEAALTERVVDRAVSAATAASVKASSSPLPRCTRSLRGSHRCSRRPSVRAKR